MTDNPKQRLTDKLAWRITRWVLDGFLIILLGASGWSFKLLVEMNANQKVIAATLESTVTTQKENGKTIDGLRLWKAETSANRFTVQDGIKLTEKMTELAEAVARIPKETPPWVIDRMDRLEVRINTIESK